MRANSGDERRKAEVIARLREDVAQLERCYTDAAPGRVLLAPPIDNAFAPPGLPLASLHEFIATRREEEAAAQGFLAAILGKLENSGIVWISKRRTIFPPGLAGFGLRPDRLVFIDLARERDALWAAEEALRCKSVTAVIAEIANIDLTSSRRLQLAAEASGAGAFILRTNPKSLGANASVSRWRIRHAKSTAPDGLPGVGFPRWDVELLKVRNGKPGSWTVEWREEKLHELAAPAPQAARPRKAGAA